MTSRFAWCHFCDDIREEVGGKHSLMGIWGPQVACPAYPFALPTLALAVYLRSPPDESPKKLTVILEAPGEQKTDFQVNIENAQNDLPEGYPSLTHLLHLRMFNYQVHAPGWMKVFVDAEGERYYAGAVFFVNQETPSEPTKAAAAKH